VLVVVRFKVVGGGGAFGGIASIGNVGKQCLMEHEGKHIT